MSTLAACASLGAALALAALPIVACTPKPGPSLVTPVRPLSCTPPADLGPTAVDDTHTVKVACAVSARSGVEIFTARATGPFSATAPGGTWRPSGTLPITLTFKPIAAGTFEGRVVLTYRVGGIDEGEESFSVRGVAQGDIDWDPDPVAPPCRADGEAPLLDRALELAGLDRASFTMADLSAVEPLNDPFRLSWFTGVRAAPHRAGCFEGEVVGALDAHLASPHPVSGAIRHAAALVDRPVEGRAMTARARLETFDAGLERLCNGPAWPCDRPSGEIPAELAQALAPVLAAIEEGLSARAQMAAENTSRTPAFWYANGGNHVLGGAIAPNFGADQRYLLGETGRRKLYGAAARIAYAVETADLARWAGAVDLHFALKTAAGWIWIRDAESHIYEDDGTATLLLLDTGGDDVHRDPAGANRNENNPVSVLIDLAGDDSYGYQEVPDPNDRPGLLPSDAEGRDPGTGATRSTRSRQGAARNGIAMLFDLGGGNDRYESLAASQGYAHQGVGVLFDDGGHDVYLAEAASQGTGIYGIGLLLDAGKGNDERRSITHSQGFGYVAGAGILFDGGGDDVYDCDPGSAGGGLLVYPSTEMPTDGNRSFCQGAGSGMYGGATKQYSGGIGILRDVAGDDTYTGSVFAQGAGYWQSTGVLSDGDGADRYEGFWYVQGAAAHFAVGILADAGAGDDVFDEAFPTGHASLGAGDDVFDEAFPTRHASLGAGHDLSLGVFISEAGNDEYHLGALAAGASSCNGIGLFVDNGGDDRYLALTDYGSGMADNGGECLDLCVGIPDRHELPGIGIMIDGGGTDLYEYPPGSFVVPAEGETWGNAHNDLPSEHGAGIDNTGETGIHAESEAR